MQIPTVPVPTPRPPHALSTVAESNIKPWKSIQTFCVVFSKVFAQLTPVNGVLGKFSEALACEKAWCGRLQRCVGVECE